MFPSSGECNRTISAKAPSFILTSSVELRGGLLIKNEDEEGLEPSTYGLTSRHRRDYPLSYSSFCWSAGIWTLNFLVKSQVLCQLSYEPMFVRFPDLNRIQPSCICLSERKEAGHVTITPNRIVAAFGFEPKSSGLWDLCVTVTPNHNQWWLMGLNHQPVWYKHTALTVELNHHGWLRDSNPVLLIHSEPLCQLS